MNCDFAPAPHLTWLGDQPPPAPGSASSDLTPWAWVRKGLQGVRAAFAVVTTPHGQLRRKASGAPWALCSDTLSGRVLGPLHTGPQVHCLAGL